MADSLFDDLMKSGRSVFPAPQRFFDPTDRAYNPKLGGMFDYTPGGRYLQMGQGAPVDITGQNPKRAVIGVEPTGKPIMKVSEELMEEAPVTTKQTGRKIKTNLFKKKAGWDWTKVPEGFDPKPSSGFPLVSVEDGKNHYYTIQAEFPEGVELSRYEKSKSEPRLRPTKSKGILELGEPIGEISVRGKKHPVYKKISVLAGVAGALASGQALADVLNSMQGSDFLNFLAPLGFEIGSAGEGSDIVPLNQPHFVDEYMSLKELLQGDL